MFLEIITPEDKIFEGEVESASFPGTDGFFQILNNHAPMISTLGKGDVVIDQILEKKRKETTLIVEGGVIEVLNNKVSVLVEHVLDQ